MDVIAILTVTLLGIAGVFHFYWAFGGKVGIDKAVPTKDGVRLLNPGKALTFFVGVVLCGFAFVAYALHFSALQTDYLVVTGWGLSVLFILRAVGEFNAVGFFKKIKSTEFARYDTRYFSPLCLFLGVAFALLSARV